MSVGTKKSVGESELQGAEVYVVDVKSMMIIEGKISLKRKLLSTWGKTKNEPKNKMK